MRLPFQSQQPADPLGPPSLTPEYILAAVTMLAGLFATQGLITNGAEKLITGIATVVVPLIFVVVQAVVKAQAHKAKANVKAAEVSNPPAGLNLGEFSQLLHEQTSGLETLLGAAIKQPPSASQVADEIVRRAGSSAERASEQTIHPGPPEV